MITAVRRDGHDRAAGAAAASSRRFSDAEILAALRTAWEEAGRAPTVKEWLAEGRRPTPSVVSARFGSWVDALRAAGIPGAEPRAGIPSRRARTREKALALLREVAGRHGGPISMVAWDAAGIRPTAHAIAHTFGGWRRAWAAAGIEAPLRRRRWTDDVILDRMREAAAGAGRALTRAEWAGRRPSAGLVVRRFGSWPAAWRAAGIGHPRDRVSLLEAVRVRLAAGGLTRAERRALEAVVEAGSEAAAAERLGLTRQAVSASVRRALRRPSGQAVREPASLKAVRSRLETGGLPLIESVRTRLEAGALTERQRQVLESLVRCGSASAAARELGLKANSVYVTVYRALRRPAGRASGGDPDGIRVD